MMPELSSSAVICLGVTTLIYVFLLKMRTISYSFALVTLPGTFFHELMHFLLALLLRGGPSSFSIFPKKTQNGIVLGSVTLTRLNIINAAPIAMAPLLLAPMAYWGILKGSGYLLESYGIAAFTLFCFINANVFLACIPSMEDFKVSFTSLVFYFLLFLWIFNYT